MKEAVKNTPDPVSDIAYKIGRFMAYCLAAGSVVMFVASIINYASI